MSNKFAEALDSGNFYQGKACIDCTLALANGENGADSEWNLTAFEATCAEYEVTLGHLHDGEYSECAHKGEPCEVDCDCDRTEFSTSACDVCGSTLHGTRFDVIMIKREVLA
jgi:hypothetical protein